MYKLTFILALLFAGMATAQTKPAPGAKTPGGRPGKTLSKAKEDSLRKDSLKPEEVLTMPRQFMVYTKKAKPKVERTRLCIQLVSPDTTLSYCMNDSLCRDPEVSKILFEQRNGDTLYVLVLIDAFTKVDAGSDDGRCSAGRETKLAFARWNTKTNQAKWKIKSISSCLRGITNMTKQPIVEWDKAAPLEISYHRGLNFYDLKFDPENYLLGLQSTSAANEEGK